MTDAATKLIQEAMLLQHLSALESWKAQIDFDIDKVESEQIRLCTESIKLGAAIKDVKKRLEELNSGSRDSKQKNNRS